MPAVTAPVSVVVPCYQCADTIERAVRSVAAQTVRPRELILVDDASPDRTGEVLEGLRERFGADWITVLRLPENVGPASARNAGWERATQECVAFLDSDDAWHPRKIEVQHAWMQANPQVAVSGHDALQLASENDMPAAGGGGGEARRVSTRELYASNRFITPSVMLRREIRERFEPGKRHMEDYLLWLEVSASGQQIARLPHVLAFTFKAPFGETGQSGHSWAMEKGELAAFSTMRGKGLIGLPLWLLLCAFSFLKFLRRVFMLSAGYTPGGSRFRPPMLYAASYLLLTQSMTALLVFAALLGRSELAADVGVVQAATMATFFAFSGNARNLILTVRAHVPIVAILATRLILLLPLGAAGIVLCAGIAHVDAALAALLVARRGIEWIGELQLSENEVLGHAAAAKRSVFMQGALLAAVIFTLALAPDHSLWAIAAWALLPAAPLLPFVARGFRTHPREIRGALSTLLPHYGSTAVTGVSLYAFRAILVLVAGKATAGDLFAAFAIGSFPGSLFANVLGPSVSLHEQRVGRAYLPRSLWAAMNVYLAGGVIVIAAALAFPAALAWTGKSHLFWIATGCSLIGGTVMVVAQRMRMRLIAAGQGEAVFGADLLTHVALVAAVPAVYAMGPSEGLATLYALNALLALGFHAAARGGLLAALGDRALPVAIAGLVFLIFLPLFFYLNGTVFNPLDASYDSGGSIRTLPIPVSVAACTLGLLLFARHDADRPVLWTIFGLLLAMLISTSVAGSDSQSVERAKMLLMLQVLLPSFGLVVGVAVGRIREWQGALQYAVLAVLIAVIPLQIITTWLSGDFTLSHSLMFFAVYQHLQFVPVILVCAFFAALPGLWNDSNSVGKIGLTVLSVLLAVYAAASHSVLSMAVMLAGSTCFAFLGALRTRRPLILVLPALVVSALIAANLVASQTHGFRNKFRFFFSPDDTTAEVTEHGRGARLRFRGGWEIYGATPPHQYLIRIAPTKKARWATLLVEGELLEGELNFYAERGSERIHVPKASVATPGPFAVELAYDQDQGDGWLVIVQDGPIVKAGINTLRWQIPLAAPQPAVAASHRGPIKNLEERFEDWDLYQRGILESRRAFLFGHTTPPPRAVKTSAHNFYIDLAYNFGAMALLPLLMLLGYTLLLLWRQRRLVVSSPPLFALGAMVFFLVLVESNLKVTLRQPYPGIAIYFLWGMLLSRLRGAPPRAPG